MSYLEELPNELINIIMMYLRGEAKVLIELSERCRDIYLNLVGNINNGLIDPDEVFQIHPKPHLSRIKKALEDTLFREQYNWFLQGSFRGLDSKKDVYKVSKAIGKNVKIEPSDDIMNKEDMNFILNLVMECEKYYYIEIFRYSDETILIGKNGVWYFILYIDLESTPIFGLDCANMAYLIYSDNWKDFWNFRLTAEWRNVILVNNKYEAFKFNIPDSDSDDDDDIDYSILSNIPENGYSW